jgi:hypothetical protein
MLAVDCLGGIPMDCNIEARLTVWRERPAISVIYALRTRVRPLGASLCPKRQASFDVSIHPDAADATPFSPSME